MFSEKNKIVVIVEGESVEVDILEKAFELFFIDSNDYIIIPFCTNIYKLYLELVADEFFDIKSLLIEKFGCDEDIYDADEILLFFDLDIHHTDREGNVVFDRKIIEKMLLYFTDEFENGKLYINYPMVESYKDVISYNKIEYKNREIKMSQSGSYKEMVNNRRTLINSPRDITLNLYRFLIAINLMKKTFFLKGSYRKPYHSEYIDFSELDLFKNIHDAKIIQDLLPVLNNIVLIILDYVSDEERNQYITKI